MSSPVMEPADESFRISEDDSFECGVPSASPIDQKKYIVFEAPLLELFEKCRTCGAACKVGTEVRGTLLTVKAECPSEHTLSWKSQPEVNRMAAGNILLSGAILFSGASATKVLRLLESINVQVISKVAYNTYQRGCLLPAVTQVSTTERECLLSSLQDRNVDLLGDGRCDSPGHSAKYLTYSFMDAASQKIINSVQIQVGESEDIRSSSHMEKAGFIRCLDEVKCKGITVASITTDRHPSVRKHMRENEPTIVHGFDIWHVVKGMKKKLEAAANSRACAALKPWVQHICNHLYWCSGNSEGNTEFLLSMWRSMSLRTLMNCIVIQETVYIN
ncbi:uncharacterized protein LOC135385556 [Ornithodoros turicata]|uniref:uncharacterized protein LOC135385556 n=1 Tax=Ornithodoros turicata TaxID=34597 RepID=UPI003139A9D4